MSKKIFHPASILILSLILIPLCGSITIGPYFSISDATQAKDFLALLAIVGIVVSSIYVQGLNITHTTVRNHFVYILMGFILISTYSAPPIRLMYGYQDVGNVWIWRAMAWAFAYFILYQAILAISLCECQKRLIAKAIGWTAIISSGYAYLQGIGLDQWQFTRPYEWIGNPAAANITAAIGNPTTLGVWLCVCLPFILTYFKKRWFFFVSGAIILTKSDFALAGLVFIPVFMACLRARTTIPLKIVVGTALLCAMITVVFWGKIRTHITDNSRFVTWEQTFKDWKEPAIKLAITENMTTAQQTEIAILNTKNYCFTGRGLDSFRFLYGVKHNSQWENPHNEYLAGLYYIGLFGLVFFLLAVGYVAVKCYPHPDDSFKIALYCAFAYLCLAAVGIPVLHGEPTRYYAAAVFSLLFCCRNNKVLP